MLGSPCAPGPEMMMIMVVVMMRNEILIIVFLFGMQDKASWPASQATSLGKSNWTGRSDLKFSRVSLKLCSRDTHPPTPQRNTSNSTTASSKGNFAYSMYPFTFSSEQMSQMSSLSNDKRLMLHSLRWMIWSRARDKS